LRRSATDLGSAGWDPDYGYGLVNLPAALAAATPPTDPQEPNEDVSEVRPGGDLGAAGNPVLAPGTISASIDAAGDPRDVYRIALPAGRKVTVRLSTGGLVLSIWGPKTTTVDERGAARRRDLLGSGKTTATARGVGDVGYVEVSLGSGTRAKAYRLTVSTR
jgi:hypothetical protein